MAVIKKYILHYKADIRSGRFAANFPAYIHGYDKNEKHVLTCVFFEQPDAVLPENKMVDGVVSMYFTIAKFCLVLDLFRNESPVKFMYDTDGKDCTLITEKEPVGEGEGLHL
ncbi:MAG: hypothetical protein HKN00_00135 [Flavobacteriaceae bacterium]|nr:hypothetical protein [Bacteroidia bacterium]MBT8286528.1 hypothetical protein [Bacteroidia bacterium]NNF73562.1 hypothetical protein [Flavobacteriaceae bacterium]NNK73110.1 hypothetical protein [Flavobacteriaceae bacterium]